MCRYAMTIYKPHYACFDCRKTFKRKLLGDIRNGAKNSVEAKCPECGKLTADMGLDFESPRKDNQKSWEYLRNLYTVGVTFHSCGCFGPGFIPKNDEELLKSLQEKKHRFIANLRFWLNRNEANSKKDIVKALKETSSYSGQIPFTLKTKKGYVSPQTAIIYWNERLSDLDEKMQNLNKRLKSLNKI